MPGLDAHGHAAGATARATRRAFRLEEATIDELHAAIQASEVTCVQVVQRYLDRARAYNGAASWLVTEDGGPARPAPCGRGAALSFPPEAVRASTFFPDLDRYNGPPLEYGRMEATAVALAPRGSLLGRCLSLADYVR